MHRIDTPTAQPDKFGAGKNGFTSGDPSTGRRATDLNSEMWDALQEEICHVIESSGLVLNKEQHDQLYQAIQTLVDSKIPDALIRNRNLSDLVDKAVARSNLGLGKAAVKDVQTAKGDATEGRVLVNGHATAANVGAVPVAGGDVAWLDNASHYSTKEGAWPGGGAFQSQLADRRALFYSAGYSAGGNVYLPMTKATVQTTGTGYQAAISYGVLVSGKNDFPSGCIHILDDQGRDHIWMFNPNDNSFTANGSIRAGASVYAGRAIFEPGGNINGEIWGGWLSTWLANQFTARDNNINTRATWDWANGQLAARDNNINTRSTWDWVNQRIGEVQSWTSQNFVSSVQLGAVISTWWPAAGGDAPAGYVLTGGDFNEDQSYVRYKPVQFWTRGGWVNAQG
jgi:hypothetical protein